MLKSFLMAVCLLTAGSAAADERPSLKIPTAVFSGAAAADWATTYTFMSRGITSEANPTINWLGDRPAATVAAGAAIDIAGAWLWTRYVGRRHPRLAAAGLYVAAGLRVAVAARNDAMIRTDTRRIQRCRTTLC